MGPRDDLFPGWVVDIFSFLFTYSFSENKMEIQLISS